MANDRGGRGPPALCIQFLPFATEKTKGNGKDKQMAEQDKVRENWSNFEYQHLSENRIGQKIYWLEDKGQKNEERNDFHLSKQLVPCS